eukprot:356565-Chlamydomonas_euryale.AAC.11
MTLVASFSRADVPALLAHPRRAPRPGARGARSGSRRPRRRLAGGGGVAKRLGGAPQAVPAAAPTHGMHALFVRPKRRRPARSLCGTAYHARWLVNAAPALPARRTAAAAAATAAAAAAAARRRTEVVRSSGRTLRGAVPRRCCCRAVPCSRARDGASIASRMATPPCWHAGCRHPHTYEDSRWSHPRVVKARWSRPPANAGAVGSRRRWLARAGRRLEISARGLRACSH